MWSEKDIVENVIPALKRTLKKGMDRKQIILTLTMAGLSDWNLNYFLDQVLDFDLGGLFIWSYDKLTETHYTIIKGRL